MNKILLIFNMSKNEVLESIYYDLERGYGSVRSLYEEAKKDGLVITLEEVREWVKNNQINKEGIIRIQTVIHRLLQELFILLILWI